MDHDEERKVIVNVPVTLNFNGVEIKTLLDTVQKIATDVTTLKSQGAKIMADIDVILQDIADQSTIEDSILTLIQSLVDNQNNPAKLKTIIAALDQNKAKLVKAVQIGTPQANNTLTISPSPLSVGVGATAQVKVVDSTGADLTGSSTYSFPDGTVATVSPAGVVTGVAAGTATLSVANGAAAGTDQVTVA